uniref:RING-type domain-containing protein n=1 Tax=Xiphophorus maculatus TaxID=8083 RepID=A0A3B5Q7N5_XIPMA
MAQPGVGLHGTDLCFLYLGGPSPDPVTIPCGHSYCLDCIEDYWNTAKQKDQYSCPQCRQVFNPKPLLSRNTVLAEVVEKFLKSEVQSAAQHLAKPEEVKCSVCKGRKNRAIYLQHSSWKEFLSKHTFDS